MVSLPHPTEFFIRYILDDGEVLMSGPIDGNHEYADRLAREIRRDPRVTSSEVVIVNAAESVVA